MDEFLSISYDITKIYRRFDNDYLYINKTCVTLCLSLIVKFNEKIGLSIIFNYDCWSLYLNIPVALCLSFRKYDFEISSDSTLKLDNRIFRRTCIYEKFWLQIQTQIYATTSRTVHRIESCYATFNNLRRLWSTLYSGNIRAPIYILDYDPLLRSNILTTLDRIFISRVTRALQRHLRIN